MKKAKDDSWPTNQLPRKNLTLTYARYTGASRRVTLLSSFLLADASNADVGEALSKIYISCPVLSLGGIYWMQ
jgi:hypothetical protein